MEAYVVVSGEFTGDANDSSFRVCGNFFKKEDAYALMMKMKEVSLKEFPNEYVDFEGDWQVIIKQKETSDNPDWDNYIYKIEITKFDII